MFEKSCRRTEKRTKCCSTWKHFMPLICPERAEREKPNLRLWCQFWFILEQKTFVCFVSNKIIIIKAFCIFKLKVEFINSYSNHWVWIQTQIMLNLSDPKVYVKIKIQQDAEECNELHYSNETWNYGQCRWPFLLLFMTHTRWY